MPNKYHGSIEDLKALIEIATIKGNWEDDGQGKHTFRSKDGTLLNWWPSTGTFNLQGSQQGKDKIERGVFQGEAMSLAVPVPVSRKLQHIFIVHGHDSDARDQLELVLRRLGLEPFILTNTSGGGKTIIEALEGQIGRDFSSDFGIVLMTPDDIGYAKKDGPTRAEPRARQNVILETGMLLSSLTRKRMTIVVKGHVEIPSDLQGIIRFGYNDHVREIVPKLCQRLKEVGFDLSPNQIAAAA